MISTPQSPPNLAAAKLLVRHRDKGSDSTSENGDPPASPPQEGTDRLRLRKRGTRQSYHEEEHKDNGRSNGDTASLSRKRKLSLPSPLDDGTTNLPYLLSSATATTSTSSSPLSLLPSSSRYSDGDDKDVGNALPRSTLPRSTLADITATSINDVDNNRCHNLENDFLLSEYSVESNPPPTKKACQCTVNGCPDCALDLESGYSCAIDTLPSLPRIQDNCQFDAIDDNASTSYFRGINYCRRNSNGEVGQQGGPVIAIARSVLDFNSTRLNNDVVFGDVAIPAGTSFRHGQFDAMMDCLRLAIEAWTSTYKLYGEEYNSNLPSATGDVSLDQLIVGASLYHSMEISIYDVERDACFKLCCPTNTESSLVLTRYDSEDGTLRIDLTFSPPYVDYNQVLWGIDTNRFPQNDNDRNQLLLKRIFEVIRANLDSFCYKDHIFGVTRLVPFHLIDTEEGRARILGRILPAVLDWLFHLLQHQIHPSETPLDWVLYMVRSYNDAVQSGVLNPNGAGGYARMNCMKNKERMDQHDRIVAQTPPTLPGSKRAFGKLLDFIDEWEAGYGGIRKAFNNWSLLCYFGESIDIDRRLGQENNPDEVDGAKLNWISGQMGLKFYEFMFAHVPSGIAKKFECLLLEGFILTAQVGVAHLIGDSEYRGLASSGDGLNEMNGGRAWLNDVGGMSMERIILWLRGYAREYPAELAMSSTLVPQMIHRFMDSNRSDISRYWLSFPPEKVNIFMLHKYISSLGGKAKSGSKRTNDGGDETQVSTQTTTAIVPRRRSSQSSLELVPLEDLIPKEMLQRMRPVPREKVVGRGKYSGKRLCRTETKEGDDWVPCDNENGHSSKYEGHCKHHFDIYASADPDNKTGWKELVKVKGWKRHVELTPKEMLQLMRPVAREKVVGRSKGGKRLCRTETKEGDVWKPCDIQNRCEGHCKLHYSIYASADPNNKTGWKEPVELTPEESLQRMRPVAREKVVGRAKHGQRLCRTETREGDDWVPCDNEYQSKCDGHCKHHFDIYTSADPGNKTGWKEPVKLTPEESLQRMRPVPREKVVGRKKGKRLCRTETKEGDDWVPCDKVSADKTDGHCRHHHGIYASADPNNKKGWKEPVKPTPEEMLQRMRPVAREKVVGRTKGGQRLCRTETKEGDDWVPCNKKTQSKCEGHCKSHFDVYASKDPNNKKGWKQ